jgi:hypothetical protein
MNGIGVCIVLLQYTHQFHSLSFYIIIQTPFDRTKVLGTTWQWSTVDTWPSPNITWVAHRFTSTTNFSLWKKVLVKRCTSKTNLRLLINTKKGAFPFEWPTESQRTGETRTSRESHPVHRPSVAVYSVCLVWSWTCIFFTSPTTHCDTHYSSHRTKVQLFIKKNFKESCPT